mmetsp:Transcript_6346/g.14523  ORF Transcript_6346/g.14523 Transcript_6346/m.14523 type:complete len:95 (+) Transcript_6346:658-942(+)
MKRARKVNEMDVRGGMKPGQNGGDRVRAVAYDSTWLCEMAVMVRYACVPRCSCSARQYPPKVSGPMIIPTSVSGFGARTRVTMTLRSVTESTET